MEYKNYQLEDFIFDEYFKRWVLSPNGESDKFWQHWLIYNSEKSPVINEAREIILFLSGRAVRQPSSEEFQEVRERIRFQIKNSGQVWQSNTSCRQPIRKLTSKKSLIYKIAATLILFTALAGTYFILFTGSATIKITSNYGETKSFILPDSSKVVLNANSTLEYPADWKEGLNREVRLRGEAFFEVVPQKVISNEGQNPRKFIVHTKILSVEVIGTKFNVNDRRNRTQVVLDEGKIRLSSKLIGDKFLSMEPGELVELNELHSSFKMRKVEPKDFTSWRNRQLIFDDQPIADIAEELEDNFGIRINIKDAALGRERYTGTVPMDNYELFFTTLSKMMEVSITKQNNSYIIRKQDNNK